MHVCVRVCMVSYVYEYVRVCACVYECVCGVCMCACVCMYECMCVCVVSVCVCMYLLDVA